MMNATQTAVQPRIYVACLASYNEGRLHGAWIDAAQYPEAIWSEIEAMLKASKSPFAEEWAIHDAEWPGGWSYGESPDIEEVSRAALLIEEHGEAFEAFATLYSDLADLTLERFEDTYCGEWASDTEFAQDLFEQCHEIPDHLQYYIDWDAVARDLMMDHWEDNHHYFQR